MKKLLNLGCGTRFHKDWINIDIQSNSKYVIAHDLKKGIPFGDNEFDMVYHSHVLEHIPKGEAENFLKECIRVLKPGGVLRIVVPDLEQITKKYLGLLEMGIQSPDDEKNWQNYQWMLIEMYDQTVRTQSGGEMLKFLKKKDILNQDFLIERCGSEVKNIWNELNRGLQSQRSVFLKKIFWFFKYSQFRNDVVHGLFFPKRHNLYLTAKFRNSGEIHQWMYDRYSLNKIMNDLFLTNIKVQKEELSYLDEFKHYQLDSGSDGSIYKPDSLFIEGIK